MCGSFLSLATNVSRLEAVANFGNVNFPLLMNFLRKINVIEPHILPLLSNRCYLLFIFFINILKIITILLVYVNISCIFTSDKKLILSFILFVMVDLLVSPLSFAPTKIGYKQYLKAGGTMQLASFQVFERRTAIEILSEKADKMYKSAMYHISQYEAYAKADDRVMTKVHLESYDVRMSQYIDAFQELRKLGVIHE